MKDLFSSIYLAAKVAAALLNAAAVVLFVRIAGDAVYGAYLIGFAFAFVAYSFATQWLLSAHFGRQTRERAAPVATAAVLTMVATLPAGLAIVATCAGLGFIAPGVALPACALVMGLAVYNTAAEIGRAQLAVGAVAGAAFLRSFGTLLLGGLTLWQGGGAAALLIAVAVAHLVAALPVALRLRASLWQDGFTWPERAEFVRLWTYGAPLVVAAGASALALSIDRIILDQVLGSAVVGPYGAVLDFTKQSFIIVGESVTISYISYAKALHGDGRASEARGVLRQASVTVAYLAVFGLAFFTLFGAPLFARLFGTAPDALGEIVVWLALGNACLLMRAYYFGQVIYFTGSVRLELRATLVALVVGAVLGLALIPSHGVLGAAIAFALTQGAALATFLASAETRRVMPLADPRIGLVVGCGLAMVLFGLGLERWLAGPAAIVLNLTAMTVLSVMLALRFDLFDAQALRAKALLRLRSREKAPVLEARSRHP